MIEFSEKTIDRINPLFSAKQRKQVEQLLKIECGDNIPFCRNNDKYEMERIRFAVLKLSEGNIEKLNQVLELAKIDWRDLLIAAGFGEDIEAHNKWKS